LSPTRPSRRRTPAQLVPPQPRRCHIAVVRTTTESHRRGCAVASPRGAIDARRCGRAALARCGVPEESPPLMDLPRWPQREAIVTRVTQLGWADRWITGPMWHWSGHDRPHVASSRLRDVRCSRWVGLKGATGSGEIGSAERAGRALAGQARGRRRAAPGSVASFTPVAEVTGTGIYQVVASPIPTCCPFPSMGISHSD